MLAQAAEQFLRDVGRRLRECHGVTENALFQLGERRALLKGGHARNLLIADPLVSAHGRVEVNSERTADEHGRVEAGEPLQLDGYRACSLYSRLHLRYSLEHPRMVCHDLDGFNETILARKLAKLSAHEPVSEPSQPAGLHRLDSLHVSHEDLPSPIVAFRSAKGPTFAEREATMCQLQVQCQCTSKRSLATGSSYPEEMAW